MKQKLIVISVLMVLLLAACAPAQANAPAAAPTAAAAALPTASPAQQVAYSPTIAVNTDLLNAVQTTFQDIYKNVNPSVVNIQVTQDAGQFGVTGGEGSGFVWDAEGHIVTNNHVIDGASTITVTFADGTVVDAKLVGADPQSDLAVIQVDAKAAELRPVTLGDSQALQVGDLVIAIGDPYGLTGTMTQGIVSALSRSLAVDQTAAQTTGSYTIPDIIQTDAAINPGNSGGVLVDVNGHVVGVTAAIRSDSGSNSGIGFVIPSHIVQRVVPKLISDGAYKHPRLGISGVTLTPSIAKEAGLDQSLQGVLVITVTPNSAADKAGLQGSVTQQTPNNNGRGAITKAGDVITAIDGHPVKLFDDLSSYLFNNTTVGQTVKLTILRGGSEQTVEVTLEAGS